MNENNRQNELLWEERDAISRANDLADIIIEQAVDDNQNIENQKRKPKRAHKLKFRSCTFLRKQI